MPKVQILDERTANQIAAGEVVERPASVVKELVENALDAGATRITVEVEGGGRDRISVVDDGCGMAADDALLALQRHATSKIRRAEDLLQVGTLGFRGEALPSIASVSRFELTTREHGTEAGTRIAVTGGHLTANEPCGCPEGTRVTVSDLFYNTPARLKYLKTSATEMAQIGDVLARLALANPQVAVRFLAAGAPVFATAGSGDRLGAAVAVLGKDVARALIPLELQDASVQVSGFAGAPAVARAGRNHQYLFVNRRPVRVLPLRYALEEAYANMLPQGRFPVCILFVDVQTDQVDVNVHPAKLEVRFEREREVRGGVYRAVKQALAAAGHGDVPTASVPASFYGPGPRRDAGAWTGAPPRAGEPSQTYIPSALPPGAFAGRLEAWSGGASAPALPGLDLPAVGATPAMGEVAAAIAPSPLPASGAELIRALRPLGQVHRSFICCDGPEGLYVVDQHAAHERVFFERFLAGAQQGATPVQPLLFPVNLDLSPPQAALWREYAGVLAESGFDAQPFGGSTLLLHGVPAELSGGGAARVVLDFLDRLLEDRTAPDGSPLERRQRVVAAMAACKAAIKAHDPLAPEEIDALLRDLAACQHPHHCPHGRPTIILVSKGELERRFGRT